MEILPLQLSKRYGNVVYPTFIHTNPSLSLSLSVSSLLCPRPWVIEAQSPRLPLSCWQAERDINKYKYKIKNKVQYSGDVITSDFVQCSDYFIVFFSKFYKLILLLIVIFLVYFSHHTWILQICACLQRHAEGGMGTETLMWKKNKKRNGKKIFFFVYLHRNK